MDKCKSQCCAYFRDKSWLLVKVKVVLLTEEWGATIESLLWRKYCHFRGSLTWTLDVFVLAAARLSMYRLTHDSKHFIVYLVHSTQCEVECMATISKVLSWNDSFIVVSHHSISHFSVKWPIFEPWQHCYFKVMTTVQPLSIFKASIMLIFRLQAS